MESADTTGNDKAPRRITEMTPAITEETDEAITDAYIDEMVLHVEANPEVFDLLNAASGECRERLEKLDIIREELTGFLNAVEARFEDGMGERQRVKEALALMLKLHINQSDRVASGLPAVAHPLAVAAQTLAMYNYADASYVIAAALLHDSIEDQSRLLTLEKRLVQEKGGKLVTQIFQEREGALNGLGYLFGYRVQVLVESLTSPELLKDDAVAQEKKNEVYRAYVDQIFNDSTGTSAAAVIKWADLQENAFIGDLFAGAAQARERGDTHAAERIMDLYIKLKGKYEPVLRHVRDFFTIVTPQHPLYAQREEAIAKIEDALANQYTLA